MATIINETHTNWDRLLDHCLMIYRVSLSRSLDETPFFLVDSRDPILQQDLQTGHIIRGRTILTTDLDEYKVRTLESLKAAYAKLSIHKAHEQQHYKRYYDKSHKHI